MPPSLDDVRTWTPSLATCAWHGGQNGSTQLAGAALVQGIQQGVEPLQVVLADHQRLDTEGAPLTSQVLDRGVGAFGVFVADGEATGGQVITLDNERHATKAGLPTLVPPCHRLYPPVTVNAGRME